MGSVLRQQRSVPPRLAHLKSRLPPANHLRLVSPSLIWQAHVLMRTRLSLTGGLLRRLRTQGHSHGTVHTTDTLTAPPQSFRNCVPPADPQLCLSEFESFESYTLSIFNTSFEHQ